MTVLIDDLGTEVGLSGPPRRVVSLVPSLTEALAVTVPDRLVDLLPEILAEKGRGPAHGLGRHQTVQPATPEAHESWVNGLTPGVDLSDVAGLPDGDLERAARALADAEGSLSERRRGVQQVMDALAGELARRYRNGEADVAALLAAEGR